MTVRRISRTLCTCAVDAFHERVEYESVVCLSFQKICNVMRKIKIVEVCVQISSNIIENKLQVLNCEKIYLEHR